MLLTTFGFSANYRVDRADGPAPIGVREFRRSKMGSSPNGIALQASTTGVVLEVAPADLELWAGRFWGGAEGLDGVLATPNADVLCVVVRGQGYWVPVRDPTAFEAIRLTPIKHVLPVPELAVLILASDTRLSACGARGFMWITEDLSWDGLKNLEVTGSIVRGTAWDSPAGRDKPFSVDVVTGKAEGGSSPATSGAPR
jgi:hypothetical protein